ncbi:hypothetical protein HPB49_013053 [Dermacentor silvarum]|uniref:Uncharacterized protein n=1 Tax=Dermacentor silvarum TaxID=543639 RepID=A0ACB8DDA3_DERSI|nr:hypothetical protein HPB49_013053 [Dermacentor silvarum]
MNIRQLKKEELLLLAAELGMDISHKLRKPEIRTAIDEVGFEEDEITYAWEKIHPESKTREEAKERERKEREEEKQHEIQMEEMRREIQQLRVQQARYNLRNFKEGENIECFLAYFEQVCAEIELDRDFWPLSLLGVFPGNVSCCLARLSDQDFSNYDEAKSALLRHFGIPVEHERESPNDDQQSARKEDETAGAGDIVKPEEEIVPIYPTEIQVDNQALSCDDKHVKEADEIASSGDIIKPEEEIFPISPKDLQEGDWPPEKKPRIQRPRSAEARVLRRSDASRLLSLPVAIVLVGNVNLGSQKATHSRSVFPGAMTPTERAHITSRLRMCSNGLLTVVPQA